VTAMETFSKPADDQASMISSGTRNDIKWDLIPTKLSISQLTAIYSAIRRNDLSTLESVLVSISGTVNFHALPALGRDALQQAVQAKSPDAVRLLLRAGANPSARGKQGRTALHWATAKDWDVEIIRLLLAEDIDLSAQDDAGRTALHSAAEFVLEEDSKLEALQLLLGQNIDKEIKDNQGGTALHYAASCGNVVATSALLRAKADVEAKDGEGRTPLHLAADAAIQHSVNLFLAAAKVVKAAQEYEITELRNSSLNFKFGYPLVAHSEMSCGDLAAKDVLENLWSSSNVDDLKGNAEALAAKHYVDLLKFEKQQVMGDVTTHGPRNTMSSMIQQWDWSRSNYDDVVDLLLTMGADRTAHDDSGRTPSGSEKLNLNGQN